MNNFETKYNTLLLMYKRLKNKYDLLSDEQIIDDACDNKKCSFVAEESNSDNIIRCRGLISKSSSFSTWDCVADQGRGIWACKTCVENDYFQLDIISGQKICRYCTFVRHLLNNHDNKDLCIDGYCNLLDINIYCKSCKNLYHRFYTTLLLDEETCDITKFIEDDLQKIK